MSTEINKLLRFNEKFVRNKDYEHYSDSSTPDRRLAVLTCMESRLSTLLAAALDLENNGVKMIRNGGASVSHPFGSVMRSLLVCVHYMDVREIAVIGHRDCTMLGLNTYRLTERLLDNGVSEQSLCAVKDQCIDLETWFKSVDDGEEAVRLAVDNILRHPLVPPSVMAQGFLFDFETGALESIAAYES